MVQPWFGLTVINIAELPIDALETIAKFLDVTATAAVIKEVRLVRSLGREERVSFER